MFTRWRLPPESSATWSSARSRRPVRSSIRSTVAVGVVDLLQPGEQAQVLGHRELAVHGRLLGHPADLARARGSRCPPSGRWIPARIESSVVLPAPLGPITATSSPRAADSDTPRSASRSPKRLTRLSASRTGAHGIGCTVALPAGMRLLFIGDVVGGMRAAHARRAAARAARAPCAGLRGGERRERRRRRGHHRAHGGRAVRRRRRRPHARQPRLPPRRGLRLPRPRAADRAPRQLPEGQPRPGVHGGGAGRHGARRGEPLRHAVPGGGALAVPGGRRRPGRPA